MEKIQLTKSQKILFIVLAIVLAYAIFDFVSHKDTYINFYSGNEQESTTPVQNMQTAAQKQADQLQANLFSQWGSDPFVRKVVVKSRKKHKKRRVRPHFKLKAISYRTDGSVALINDRIVKSGDVISGYKVVKIEQKKVVLWDGKHRIVLNLTNM